MSNITTKNHCGKTSQVLGGATILKARIEADK